MQNLLFSNTITNQIKTKLIKMKQLFLMLTLFTFLGSCNKAGENEYIVTGTINEIDGKTVILEKQDETGQITPIDTVKIESGKFTFKGTANEPEMYLIQVEAVQGKLPFILENGDIEMTVNKDSINIAKVSGTYNNDELTSYKEAGMKIQKKMMKFQQDNTAKMNEAQQKKDTVMMNNLREEYGAFEREFIKQSDDYVATHPKSFIATLIIQGMMNSMNLDLKKVTKYYNALDQSLKDTKPGKSIKTKLDQLGATVAAETGVEIGSSAPDFSAPNPDGKIISLTESLGKVTLIDFWASWCGPCRAENPNVVALYNEFHAKGFNIIGVSLDKDADKWKEAINKDKLIWNQISNLKFWEEPIAVTYGVQSIPATYLLDASGKIIAKDLRGADLRKKISSLLKAK